MIEFCFGLRRTESLCCHRHLGNCYGLATTEEVLGGLRLAIVKVSIVRIRNMYYILQNRLKIEDAQQCLEEYASYPVVLYSIDYGIVQETKKLCK